jgi:predicted CXXCH cytochrome family protein
VIALVLVLGLLQEPVKTDAQCMECHKEAAAAWKTSVHAKHETGCISCHKTDVVNPTAEKKHSGKAPFIAGTLNLSQNLCVQCHVKETEEFKKGPHWDDDINPAAKWSKKKRQGCLTCHEQHGTLPAERKQIYDQRCTHCHKENSSQRKLMTSYMAAADPFDAELAALKKFLEHPLPGVPYEKAELAKESAEELHKALRMLQHNCEFKALEKKIEPALPSLKKASEEIQQQYAVAKSSRRNYFFGFLGLMVVNLFLLRAWCMKKYKH